MEEEKKAIHSIILDTNPLLLNNPSISTLLKKSEKLFTTPSVLAEVKDPVARSRLETTVTPFLLVRVPDTASVKVVSEFARKSGDLAVLSKTDLEVLALAYELECERNHGDWRLRRTPGQKELNGSPPKPEHDPQAEIVEQETLVDHAIDPHSKEDLLSDASNKDLRVRDDTDGATAGKDQSEAQRPNISTTTSQKLDSSPRPRLESTANTSPIQMDSSDPAVLMQALNLAEKETDGRSEPTTEDLQSSQATGIPRTASQVDTTQEDLASDTESDNSSDGEWITPSNLSRHLSTTTSTNSKSQPPKTLQVATITSDFALQNVLLLMNLNLLSPTSSLTRITHLKSTILRCHGCFATTKDQTRQFCPRCGKPTLTRVTATTNASGKTQLHLKKNMQWNNRGNRYSIPKPVAGSSSGKGKGQGKSGKGAGGKGGWGQRLILAEDQKEYVKAVEGADRERRRDEREGGWDEDRLPGILTGERRSGGRIRIGAGRDVNGRKERY
ncbi:Nin1 binding protein [Thelotrema lepadinum]|nr:Nin1 binding protein [Thelotrema lepadinum]